MSTACRPRPAVSIIIVNWKVRELLRQCLQSIPESTQLPACDYEIVVVDNDSADGSVEMLQRDFPAVQVVANPCNLGFAAANNQALPLCRGDYLLLLNPDTLVLPGAIDTMVGKMRADSSLAVLGCRLLNGDRSLQKWTGGAFPTAGNLLSHYLFLDRIVPASLRPAPLYLDRDVAGDIDVDWVSGACMMLRRSAVTDSIFDPAFFMYAEDMELCHRIRRAGGRVVYTGAVSIVHYQGESMRQQVGEVMLSSIKGPRMFFARMHGSSRVWLFDLVTLAGFTLRWIGYSLVSALGSDMRLRDRARSSRRHMRIAWQLARSPVPEAGTPNAARPS
ncbi:MAG: glycosyltransferase family 2 protein [Burkholderiaceae bacterium]|nr:glycosyltransferase family 2 protein [Burkholderiaceae bacterium]MEB2350091.1 glycosyltransferase family 2 protein [Burkholderiaceae bacterium]